MGRLAHTGWAGVKRVRVGRHGLSGGARAPSQVEGGGAADRGGLRAPGGDQQPGDREVRVLRVAGPVSAGRGCGGCRRSPAAPARTRAGSGRCRTRSASAGCASGTPGRARPSCMSCTTGSIPRLAAGRREAHRVLAAEAPPHPALRLRGARRAPQATGLQRQPCAPMGHAAGTGTRPSRSTT